METEQERTFRLLHWIPFDDLKAIVRSHPYDRVRIEFEDDLTAFEHLCNKHGWTSDEYYKARAEESASYRQAVALRETAITELHNNPATWGSK